MDGILHYISILNVAILKRKKRINFPLMILNN